MRIRTLIEAASTTWEIHKNEVIDVDDTWARELIAQGMAEPWPEADPVESASTSAPERATRRRPRARQAVRAAS